MPKVYSQALDEEIEIKRLIGHRSGKKAGPCLVFLAGIHGNEPSGIFALKQVFDAIDQKKLSLNGSIYGIAGNLWALERGERFHTIDLNRLWTRERIDALESDQFKPQNEDEQEQLALQTTIESILKQEKGPFYFFDLHTTSGPTIPFITVNDSLLNRRFTSRYPLPSILGIEEELDGPLLSYLNELGYVSFGFEAGQHDALSSIENHHKFIWVSMALTGLISETHIPIKQYLDDWKRLNPDHQAFYEIYERYSISPKEDFKMKPGFSNFQKVKKGAVLAESNDQLLKAASNTTLFMPLYQPKGEDGYFLIKRTPYFFLRLSAFLRRLKLDRIFPYLPGVNWTSPEKDSMEVDQRIARFISRPLFHLFGYRSKQADATHLQIRNREYRSKEKEYHNESWYHY